MPSAFSHDGLLNELEALCSNCRKAGLGESDVRVIMSGARATLQRGKRSLPCSAVLNEFVPLNVMVGDGAVGFAEFAAMVPRGPSFLDVAMFLASVEALEKYPFCNRQITGAIQESFVDAYGVTEPEMAVLRVLKMKALLAMFAHGRVVKDNAVRKKVMWATVMKRFIQQAAQRSLHSGERAA
jgi:hypothetical protein